MRSPAAEHAQAALEDAGPPRIPSPWDDRLGAHAPALEALADTLAATAAARDAAGGTAFAERRLMRESGLLALAIPRGQGGLGADWPLVLRAVRRLARADSSLAHLFAFQHVQVASVLLFGSPAQHRRLLMNTVAHRWFWGNAVNARDPRLTATREDGGWRLAGAKSFCSGARDSDVLNVSVTTGPAPQDRLFIVVPTSHPGIEVLDDWDAMGQRQTDSGTVLFRDVRVTDADVLGLPGAASSPRATLRNLLSQLVLAEIYIGNAQGALADALAYVRAEARPWPGAGVAAAADDALLQLRAGELWAGIEGATAQADAAHAAYQAAWDLADGLDMDGRTAVATRIAAARIEAARVALHVTAQVFELMGARATAAPRRLDRYWRNVRVHTLHDPLDHRARGLGRWLLTGEPPDPFN